MTWHASVLTLFPAMFPGPLGHSLAGRALERGTWSLTTHDIRDHGEGRHRTVDDVPFGGGVGMVMRPDIADRAIAAARAATPAATLPLVYLTPRGRPFTQPDAVRLAAGPGLLLLCGRYEGVDERVLQANGAEEISVGDYVLSGGELAAMILLDAIIRLLPGVMGKAESGRHRKLQRGPARTPALYPPRRLAGPPRSRRAPVRPPRRHRKLAPRPRAGSHPHSPPRSPGKDQPVNIIQQYEAEQIEKLTAARPVPVFAPGDTVRVSVRVVEGERQRLQAYEGVVIARSNKGLNSNFTVRKISYGEGVERVFPLYAPTIAAIDVVRRGDVRRAKLYYLRGRRGKSARIAERAREDVKAAE